MDYQTDKGYISPNTNEPGVNSGQKADFTEVVVIIRPDGTFSTTEPVLATETDSLPAGEQQPEQPGTPAVNPARGLATPSFPTWDDLNTNLPEPCGVVGPSTSLPAIELGHPFPQQPLQSTFGQADGPPSPESAAVDEHVGTLDQIVEGMLSKATPGWTQAELERWVYEVFLATLADFEGLTAAALTRHLDSLIVHLAAVGYKPRTHKQYLSVWKKIAKLKGDERKAHKLAERADQEAAGHLPGRFTVKQRLLPAAHEPQFTNPWDGQRRPDGPSLDDLQTDGIFDNQNMTFLTNFDVVVHEEVEVQDEFEQGKVFKGKVRMHGRESPFAINARDFADNNKLRAMITETAGVAAVIHGKMDVVREAISTLNWSPGRHQLTRRSLTTDFGWTAAGDAFLVPSGRITVAGFASVDDQSERRVELTGEELARHLDLQPLASPEELRRVKRHIVEDLLQLHDRRVTYSLLAATAAALLARFAPSADAFALWLVGLTGAGKSFLAKLFMNFFGAFPVTSGRCAAWSATPNYLQRQGYYFKDTTYLIDDYKPEVIPPYQAVRVLQNYADRIGRGRLKADATTNTSRPIRGLLVSTGEDVPEHNASAVARSIVIDVPQRAKDLERGARCVTESAHYKGVMADFIQHLLAQGRTGVFAEAVTSLRQHYYQDIAGQQNDSRIAGNFALLAAAFVEIARYFADVWPEWEQAAQQFLHQDLVTIRDQMLGTVREQQTSEVFWSTLANLLTHDVVTCASYDTHGKPRIGKRVQGPGELVIISTDLAMAAVNKCLREQGRPELKVTAAALIGQLRREGRLLDETGKPLNPEGKEVPTKQLRIEGQARRSFITSLSLLLGSEAARNLICS